MQTKPSAAHATVRTHYPMWWESAWACWPRTDINSQIYYVNTTWNCIATFLLFVSPQGFFSLQNLRLLLMTMSPSKFSGSCNRTGEISAASWAPETVVWFIWRNRRREWEQLCSSSEFTKFTKLVPRKPDPSSKLLLLYNKHKNMLTSEKITWWQKHRLLW